MMRLRFCVFLVCTVLPVRNDVSAAGISSTGQRCQINGHNTVGFCVTSDSILSQCVGSNAVIQKSKDCTTADNWCCFNSSISEPSDAKRHRALTEERTASVDSAPCGHGNNLRKISTGAVSTGIRQFARVFQGTPTVDGDFCWVAAIFTRGNASLNHAASFACTGSIINSTHIITAGHCVDSFLTSPSQIIVQTGISNASPIAESNLSPCAQQFDVIEIILPALFDPEALTEDHALLRIDGSIRADECSCRVCLPDRVSVPEISGAASCWVGGFGATREGGAGSFQLNKAPIQFIRKDRCAVLLGDMLTTNKKRFPFGISDFCAGDAQLGGLCSHDGGAPLTCIIGGRHTLIGVGSWSVDCSKYPSVFSSIAACADFLNNVNAPCDPQRASLKGAVALTDLQLNGGPTCGIPGTSEIDPFNLANQSPSQQMQDVSVAKHTVQSILASMTATTSLVTSTSFHMMPEDNIIPEIPEDEVEEKQATLPEDGEFPKRPIVGGAAVPPNQICWQVLLSTGCGGSIISDQFVLTAAHCVTQRGTTTPRNPAGIKVILGATSSPVQFPLTDCQQIRKVRRIIVHEGYFLGNSTVQYVENDIALLELEKPIDFSKPCVCRICLQTSEPTPGEMCTASGFGCQLPTAPSASCADRTGRQLMRLNLMMPGDDVCSLFFKNFPSDRVTCSASGEGHAPCFGDSGGPVVCYNREKSTYYQAGITSFAVFPDGVLACGAGRLNFQYYTKINAFIDWIQRTTPDVMVAEPSAFTFHASFNIDLGKGVSSIVTKNQLLPANG